MSVMERWIGPASKAKPIQDQSGQPALSAITCHVRGEAKGRLSSPLDRSVADGIVGRMYSVELSTDLHR